MEYNNISTIDNSVSNVTKLAPIFLYPNAPVVEVSIKGIALILVALFGTFGNLLSIVILFRMKISKSSMNILLLGLSIFDLVFVICSIFNCGLSVVFSYFRIAPDYSTYVEPFAIVLSYYIGYTAQTGSIYFTMLITFERYIAVCHPLKARYMCTPGRVKLMAIGTTLFTILFNFPMYFEMVLVYNDVKMAYVAENTAFGYTTFYEIYQAWLYVIFIFVVPFFFLLIFNILICRSMAIANKARTSMTSQEKESNSFTMMLFAIVITFLICNCIFYPLLLILDGVGSPLTIFMPTFVWFFFVLNSSVNFIYYLAFGKQFRKEVRNLFPCIVKHSKPNVKPKSGTSTQETSLSSLNAARNSISSQK